MSVEILERDVALLAGIESTYGTAATIAATNVLYANDISFSVNETTVSRDFRTPARPTDMQAQAVRKWWEMSANFPYAYSGTAGTASALEPIILMCGGSQTVDSGTSVTYTRERIDLLDSATIDVRTPLSDNSYDYQRMALGARGQLGFRIAPGEDIVFNASWSGLYQEPGRVSVITPDYGSQKTNLFGSPKPSLVSVKTLDGNSVCLTSIEASNFFSYSVEFYEDMCEAKIRAMDSDPGTITLQMAMPDWVSGFNPYVMANRDSLNTVPLVVTVGTTAGQILTISVDELQMSEPNEVILGDGSRGMELTGTIIHEPKIIES